MVLLIVFTVSAILLIPIKFTAKLMLSISEKKLYYSITAINLMKINCGYIDFKSASIKVVYSNSNLKFITLNDLTSGNGNINVFKHFNCLKVSSIILLGQDAEEYKYYLCALINCLNPIIYTVLKEIQPYLQYKNDVLLLGNESSSGALAEIDYSANIITIAFFAILKAANLFIGKIRQYRRNKNVKGKSKQ